MSLGELPPGLAHKVSSGERTLSDVQAPMPASRRLYEGKRVLVWWQHDNCSYPATINKLSHSEVELIYEDGLRKSYRRDGSISRRMSLGELSPALARKVLSGELSLEEALVHTTTTNTVDDERKTMDEDERKTVEH